VTKGHACQDRGRKWKASCSCWSQLLGKVLPAKDKEEQVRGMKVIGTLFCALLFGAGALIVILRLLLA
jgi:hypothetical protein